MSPSSHFPGPVQSCPDAVTVGTAFEGQGVGWEQCRRASPLHDQSVSTPGGTGLCPSYGVEAHCNQPATRHLPVTMDSARVLAVSGSGEGTVTMSTCTFPHLPHGHFAHGHTGCTLGCWQAELADAHGRPRPRLLRASSAVRVPGASARSQVCPPPPREPSLSPVLQSCSCRAAGQPNREQPRVKGRAPFLRPLVTAGAQGSPARLTALPERAARRRCFSAEP